MGMGISVYWYSLGLTDAHDTVKVLDREAHRSASGKPRRPTDTGRQRSGSPHRVTGSWVLTGVLLAIAVRCQTTNAATAMEHGPQ